jgi:hypothetical protein
VKLTSFCVCLLGAGTLLAGCAGLQTGTPGAPSQATSTSTNRARHVPVGPLLYISDQGTGQVQVFNYPAGSLYQTLTGFAMPAGECVDNASNVYVTDTGTNTIVKYAHGNAIPVATLSDPGQLPVACAVKANTVAVANVATTSGPPGSISIYLNNATSPNFIYSNPTVFLTMNYVGYYLNILYLDGLNPSSTFQFGKMNNSGTFIPIAITGPGGAPAAPGGVQHPPWAVSYIAIGDAAGSNIYHVFTNGYSVLNPPNSPTMLTGTCGNILQFFLVQVAAQQHEVINPESCAGNVGVHKYPAGGPSGYNYTTSLVAPVGVVVSP